MGLRRYGITQKRAPLPSQEKKPCCKVCRKEVPSSNLRDHLRQHDARAWSPSGTWGWVLSHYEGVSVPGTDTLDGIECGSDVGEAGG